MDRLERAHEDFNRSVSLAFNNCYSMMTRTQKELKDFKDEMRADRAESRAESRAARIEMNRKWGELANKMGTMVEDLVHPSMPRIIRERFGEELEFFTINLRKRKPEGVEREFDAIGIVKDHLYLNSTKSKLHFRHIDSFPEEIAAFREFFPESRDKKIIGLFAALSVPDNLIGYAERKGFLVITIGDSLMECINSPSFQPREF